MAPRLTVLVRRGCHLCTDMVEELELLRSELGFEYSQVDVDRDPELVLRYSTRVPVLLAGETEVCYYFLEEDSLRATLADHVSR